MNLSNMANQIKKSKSRNNDIMFIKQILMNLRDRLKKLNRLRKTDEVKFIKQLPFHPAERLKRKENRNLITTKG